MSYNELNLNIRASAQSLTECLIITVRGTHGGEGFLVGGTVFSEMPTKPHPVSQ